MTDVITEVTTMTAEHLSTRGSFHFDIPLVYACSIVQLVTSSMSNQITVAGVTDTSTAQSMLLLLLRGVIFQFSETD